MACIRETANDERDGTTKAGNQVDCTVDCTGEIILTVGVGILVGSLVVAVGRWVLRYLVKGNFGFVMIISFFFELLIVETSGVFVVMW